MIEGLTSFVQMMPLQDICEFEPEGDNETLLIDHLSLKRELMEMRGLMEELKKDNLVKSRECKEAKRDLQELQNELMRKSMHVGSLGMETSPMAVFKHLTKLLILVYCSFCH